MIASIRRKGLRRLHETDDHRGVLAHHAEKLRRVLARLEASKSVADMDLPGYRLHPLKGDMAGFHAINGNWRVIFRFQNSNAMDVDYVDYH